MHKGSEDKRKYDRNYHKNRSPEAKAHKVHLQKLRRQAIATEIRKYKAESGCVDCGFNNVHALDFDHRDESLKTVNIADCLRCGWSIDRIMLEVEKCDVRCANCHRIRTAEQFSWQ